MNHEHFSVVRAHARCRACGRKGQVAAVRVNTLQGGRLVQAANLQGWRLWDNQGRAHPLVAFCARCHAPVAAQELLGKVKPKVRCGARCVSSTGHVCECACGGANHGTGA